LYNKSLQKMKEEEKIEVNVKNGDNFHIPKDVYVQWLKQSLERSVDKEDYEKCVELRDKIKSLELQ
jgi:protein-arginine kinase activator protein McsA